MVCPVIFNATNFIAAYPQFSAIPTATLNNYFSIATAYIQNGGYTPMNTAQLTQALNLMVAHLAQIGIQIAVGNTPQILTGSSVSKVSVTLEPPPAKNQFQWWCNTTPYGSQLLMLLEVVSAGGFYVTSRPSGVLGFRW